MRCCGIPRLQVTVELDGRAAAVRLGGMVEPALLLGFLFSIRPHHTRLRKLVSNDFAPKVVNALQPDITAMVDGLDWTRSPSAVTSM